MVRDSLSGVIKESMKESERMGKCMELGDFSGRMELFIEG